MKPPIQIFEHESLTTTKDQLGRCISEKQFERLCEFNDRNQNKYFTVIRNGVKFGQYVGVIHIGGLTIEVLPKADKHLHFENNDQHKRELNRWQKVLMKMLALSDYVKLETVSEAFLRKHFTLLDLYFEIFLNEVELLLRRGLVKKYHNQTSNLNALKGRIHFPGHIRDNLVHQERFHTIHQCYDHEHLLNQILLKALQILSKITLGPVLSDKISRVSFCFPEIREKIITASDFQNIVLNRKTQAYSEALKIAKMLILNYSPDISHGEDDMLALLFDMNKLWESYIYRMLKRQENDSFEVFRHESQKFWTRKHIYPDIVIRQKPNGNTYIIDTKWKIVEPTKPSDDDLKQMYVYNMYWQSQKSMLLYPAREGLKELEFYPYHPADATDFIHQCKVGFLEVLDGDGGLNMAINKSILDKLQIV